jgi:hypothetical protein
MQRGAGNGTRPHSSSESMAESEAGIRESGRDDVAMDEEEEYMLRGSASRRFMPALLKACHVIYGVGCGSGIGGATGEDARATCMPEQSAPITRGGQRVQLRLLPRSSDIHLRRPRHLGHFPQISYRVYVCLCMGDYVRDLCSLAQHHW